MGIYSIKPRFQQTLMGAEGWLIRWGIHPDHLTLAALVLSIAGGVALWASAGQSWLLLLVPPLAIVRTALNALDGMVAKRTGLARPWGEVLNESCDRFADVAFFLGVALAPGSDITLGAAAIVAMLLSSYVGTASKAAGGRRLYLGVMGKADRMIYLSVAAVVSLLLPGVPVFRYFLMLVLAGLVVTIGQRLRSAYVALESHR